MKTEIESRISGKVRERSYSSSSEEIGKCSTTYSREDYKYKKHKHRRKHEEKRDDYKKKRYAGSSDNSDSEGVSGTSNTNKYANVKRERSESRSKHYHESGVNCSNVRVKEEQDKNDDDDDDRLPAQYRGSNMNRPKDNSSRKNRWNRSRSRDNDDSNKGGGDEEHQWGKASDGAANRDKKKPIVNTAKPDFGLSGKLTEETNTYNGVVIKYSEPPEARKPKRRWRLYQFKGEEDLPTLYIHRQSAFLIGRDYKVADIRIDHPSCSKQHAALQYRLVPFTDSTGRVGKRICPYIIDLESANGTFINNVKIEPKKYVQLLEKDVIKFAFSSREYVLLHEHSKDSGEDDNM